MGAWGRLLGGGVLSHQWPAGPCSAADRLPGQLSSVPPCLSFPTGTVELGALAPPLSSGRATPPHLMVEPTKGSLDRGAAALSLQLLMQIRGVIFGSELAPARSDLVPVDLRPLPSFLLPKQGPARSTPPAPGGGVTSHTHRCTLISQLASSAQGSHLFPLQHPPTHRHTEPAL